MDANTFAAAMTVGASLVGPHAASLGTVMGTELVKEGTKDCYKALKHAVGHVLGSKGRRAVERLEADPASSAAQDGMADALAGVAEEDLRDLDGELSALLAVLRDDQAAIRVGEAVASIKLDIDSKGDVAIKRVRGVGHIDIESRSDGNFELSDIDMSVGGKPQGN